MKRIVLDAHAWRSREDFYDALLPALGAPEWHGHNLDALNDTILGDDINELKLPYRIEILGCDAMSEDLRAYVAKFEGVIRYLRDQGVDVDLDCAPHT